MKNFLTWLRGKPSQQSRPSPWRELRERVNQHDIDISDLWGAVNSLSLGVSSAGARIDALEQRPGIPLPTGFHMTPDDDGTETIIFGGFEPLEPVEPIEEVSYDGE